MSKKLYSTEEWKVRSRRKQDDQLRKVKRRKDAKLSIRRKRIRQRTKSKRDYKTIVAPNIFSLVQNAEGVVSFLREVKSLGGRNHLSFDFSGITVTTIDAVAAFIATISVVPDLKFRGNIPTDPAANEMLSQSGFFDHVRSRDRKPSHTKGRIQKWESKRVEPKFAQSLIHAGTKAVFNDCKHQPASYRVLIESMTNTCNHASERSNHQQTWWATVYADLQAKCVCYTILDMGVGIFRSLKVRWVRKVYKALGMTDNTKILRDILEGRIESSTGIDYRGKGLPAIYRLAKGNRVRNLVIITNDVYANVSKGEFRLLPTAFNGTLLYWEG